MSSPHFSSGIAERSERECKTPHATKARRGGEAFADAFSRWFTQVNVKTL